MGGTNQSTRNQHRSRIPLVALFVAQFAISSDTTTVAIAARDITAQFGASMADIQLANMMFGTVAGIFMITGGFVGLLVGWRKTFCVGAILACAGEVSMALAPSVEVFIWVGRVLVGLGASALIPAVLGMIPALYEGRDRSFAFGCVAAGTGAAALMPLPYGLLLDMVGLRATFLIAACLFVVVLGLSRLVPSLEGVQQGWQFDRGGFVLGSFGFFFVLIGIASASTCGIAAALPTAPVSLGGISPALPLVALGAVLLVVFARSEQAKERAGRFVLMPTSFFGTPEARHGLLAVAFGFFVSGALSIAVVPYMQMAAGVGGLGSGLLFVCAGLPMVLLGLVAPKLLVRFSSKRLIQAGYVFAAVGFFATAFGLGCDEPLLPVAVSMVVLGMGIGLANSQANFAVAKAVGERDAQQSGGMQGTVRDIANALAISLVGTAVALILSVSFHGLVAADDAISQSAQTQLSHLYVVSESDAAFIATVEREGIDEQDASASLVVYRQARLHANQIAMTALGAGCLLLLVFTRKLPGKVGAGA